jgi:hypothetical protein
MAITKPGTASWPNLIAQWRLSGLTQAEFCSRAGGRGKVERSGTCPGVGPGTRRLSVEGRALNATGSARESDRGWELLRTRAC